MDTPSSAVTIRRIFFLLVAMFFLSVFQTWQIYGLRSALENQEKEMPTVTITVTATRGSNNEAVTVPITTTQGEMPDNADETEAEWIARTWATRNAWKTAIENS